jgi:hypothetical protein
MPLVNEDRTCSKAKKCKSYSDDSIACNELFLYCCEKFFKDNKESRTKK